MTDVNREYLLEQFRLADKIRLYDRALSGREIEALYKEGNAGR